MTDTRDRAAVQEPMAGPSDHPKERRSSITKLMDALKKPFHHEKTENPPALQEAIDKMEARKERTALQMEEEGKDTSVLSGKRRDVANPLN